MSIRGNEKVKLQKTIDDVASGTFDERDIDHLFIGLRAHSGKHSVFKEVADYVAHNELRDQGITNQALEAFYLSVKYFFEYVSPKVALDIAGPFPLYIKKLMKYQVDKCDEGQLQHKFSVTKTRLKSRIDNLFKDDTKSRTTSLKAGKISQSNFETLQYILGFIGSHPAYTQEQILSELLSVIKENDLIVDEEWLAKYGNMILLCVLTLIHNTQYDFKGHKKGYCKISCETIALPYGMKYVDSEGNEVKVDESYGNLQINGYVALNNNGSDVTVCFPVVTSNLAVDEWCEHSMFSIEPTQAGDHRVCLERFCLMVTFVSVKTLNWQPYMPNVVRGLVAYAWQPHVKRRVLHSIRRLE